MKVHRPTFVVVDDEPEVLRSLHDLFRLEYRVLTFERPTEALSALSRETEVDVIMSDQRMPEMSGVRFLEAASGLHPDATRLLITGYADIKAVIDAINRGHVFRYVTKPWDADELAAILHQAVERHKLIAEKNRLLLELKASNAQLVEANRLKGKFMEVISHELNTPVTVVLGLTELWKLTQSDCASPAERTWVERIHVAGTRLASTVDRMLKLLKANRLAPTLNYEIVELAPLIRQAVDQLRPFLEARNQEIQFEIDPFLGSASVDRTKIFEILTNLIVNAIKFTPDAGTISIEARPVESDRVLIRVKDQGAGIDPGDCSHLFEPFFTGNDTLHHSSGDYQFGKRGMGLGLCLVKTYVELHGGAAEVETAPGFGSTFSVTLPRNLAEVPKGELDSEVDRSASRVESRVIGP
ncbi:ATP-binding protein [Tundrisphaera lichenicola]|uniref:ATP-binding protein n=1 Tax=Tundrisphaera lichenicola TaxID=2029860 RepID=UPI003EBC550B